MAPEFYAKVDDLLQTIETLRAVDEGVVSAACPSLLRLSIYTKADAVRVARAKPMSEVIAPPQSIIAHHPGCAT